MTSLWTKARCFWCHSWGHLARGTGAHSFQLLLLWEDLERSEAWANISHSCGKATVNSLFGSVNSVGQSLRESPGQGKWWSQVDGVSDTVPIPCASVERKTQKNNDGLCQFYQQFCLGEHCHPALSLLLDISVPPCMPLVPFKLLPWCWNSEGVSLSESMHVPFKGNYLGIHRLSPHWFLQPEVMRTHIPGTGTLGWGTWHRA